MCTFVDNLIFVMTIRYLKNKEIDRNHWDKLIGEAFNGRVYAYSWYLDALLGESWDALIMGDYEYVMPMPWRRKFGIYYIYTPFFVQQLGIFSRQEIPADLYIEFFKNIPIKFRYLDLGVNLDSEISSKNVKITKKRTNYVLDIDRSYEEIKKEYTSVARRKLNKDQGYILNETHDFGKVISDYRISIGPIVPMKDADYKRLEKLAFVAFEKGCLFACNLENNVGETLSSCFFLMSHGRSYYFFGSQSQIGREVQATHFLVDKFIQRFCQKIKTFDFCGSDLPGVAEFIKKWGATPEYYSNVKMARFPFNLIR